MSSLLESGYRSARAVVRHHAKSFYLASFMLAKPERRAAYALYAFCRHLDDLVDESSEAQAVDGLASAAELIDDVFHRPQAAARARRWPFDSDQLLALRDTLGRYAIDARPFEGLISGLETDLHRPRFERTEELLTYCDRVAGTVGLMLLPVLGAHAPGARLPALALGRAMQLTNILRDVGEDLGRGRRYLPSVELARFGLTDRDLERRTVDERFVAFMRWQIDRARRLYQHAEGGLSFIPSRRGRALVQVMSRVYGGILGAIEEQGYDVYSRRAQVGLVGKLVLATRAIFSTGAATVDGALDGPERFES